MKYPTPTESGYYWAHLKDEVDWEIIDVDLSGTQPMLARSGHYIAFDYILEDFVWGPKIEKFKNDKD
jgi:hypothetical protein